MAKGSGYKFVNLVTALPLIKVQCMTKLYSVACYLAGFVY